MTKLELVNKAARTFARAGLKFKKYSPEIMAGVGAVGVVVSGVLACKATTKASAILEETKADIDAIHECLERDDLPSPYTEEESKQDLVLVYTQTAVKFVKLYAPSVALGVASIGCMLASNHILRKRNIALAAAYAAVDKTFKDYRGRVIERFGKELDRELKFNIKAKEIEETVVDAKGKEKKVKKTIEVADPNQAYNIYTRCFDDGCLGWDKDPEYNKMFLLHQQNHANDLLHSRGHLFLNEVFDMLGFPRTAYGNIVGWYYDEKNPIGDNFVDFGIFDINDEKKKDFVNGFERSIWLDFNVDGNILDLI